MDYTAIRAVSRALKDLLATEFATEPSVNAIVGGAGGIVFSNPTETAQNPANRLSLWLYQVTENEFLKNDPVRQGTSLDRQLQPPLPLNLFYLLTPFALDRESDLLLLGKSMEVLYDNAIIRLTDPLNNRTDELRLILCRLTLEELTRIWEALREPYRLSVCYQIRVTRIDSQRAPETERVLERTAGFGSKPVTMTEYVYVAITYHLHRTTADAVFAVEDAHARRRLSGALHPVPIGGVEFRVVGPRVGGVLLPFSERTTMVLVRTDSGFSAFAREVTVQMEDGSTFRRRLRDGTYVIRVKSDFYQQFPDFDLTLPNPAPGTPQTIDLEPGFNYPFLNSSPLRGNILGPACILLTKPGRGPTLLRGSLHGPGGAPLDGAVVSVDGMAEPTYRTDETGQWVLVFPDAPPQPTGPVTIRVTRPNALPIVVAGVCVVRGRETSLRETALRGYVLRGGLGVAGARVAVNGWPQRAITAADGGWFVYFGLGQAATVVNLLATLPTGEQRPANNIPVTPRATNVVPTFQFP